MACFKLTPLQLPTFGGIGLPTFNLPAFSGGFDLCCQINLLAFVKLPPLPPIPLLSTVLAIINAEIVLVDQFLRALDLISFSCPLDDVPINVTVTNA